MALLFTFCYHLFAFPISALGAPADSVASQLSAAGGNLTILKTEFAPAWVSAANYRGTADILWSCLLTLAACIYNAIHLNVPPDHESRLQFFWRKIRWVAMALFGPEIVLYTAYAQYSEARELVKTLNKLRFGDQNKSEKEKSKDDQTDNNDADKAVVREEDNNPANNDIEKASVHRKDNNYDSSDIEEATVRDKSNNPDNNDAEKASVHKGDNKPDNNDIKRPMVHIMDNKPDEVSSQRQEPCYGCPN